MIANRGKIVLLIICLAASVVVMYLWMSIYTYRIGFPLDDAWIHQTYARNLSEYHEWSFIPGEPSGGSTSPVWSGLLSIGYLLGLAPYFWTYLLGLILFATTSVLGYFTFKTISTKSEVWALAAGVILVLEWHLIWAAVSGMETTLFTMLVLLIVFLLTNKKNNWFLIGGLIGLSVWVRPDGLTLTLPAILKIVIKRTSIDDKLRWSLDLIIGLLFFAAPYLLFNQRVAGNWLPNTFFAKQAEYAIELQEPLVSRILEQALLPLVGVGICLLPGFILFILDKLRNKSWRMLLGPIWALGYLCLYAIRLPVTYQHGRYVIPMMPIYFVWGFAGLTEFITLNSEVLWKRLFSRVWLVTTLIIMIAFSILGANAYARDVAVIESEMVNSAAWVAENTDPGALIAAHDIGALGYFGKRRLLDLAGLITPDVIPFIRDEAKLAEYITSEGADYLITFPGWYHALIDGLEPVFQTDGQFSPKLGGENMKVYRWEAKP